MKVEQCNYENPPDDPGVFVPRSTLDELDSVSSCGIHTFFCPKRNVGVKIDSCAYFIIVGGGYRGFKKRSNATNDLKYGK